MIQNIYQNRFIVIDDEQIRNSYTLTEAISEVEMIFRFLSNGQVLDSNLMNLNAEDGEYHIKGGIVKYSDEEIYFGLKTNGRFIHNMKKYGMPNINGLIYLSNARNGLPLAVLDSGYITRLRTAAATAIAAKYLSGKEENIVTICGAGVQGKIQLEALTHVKKIARAYLFDIDYDMAKQAAIELGQKLSFEVTAVEKPGDGTLQSNIVVTCTPAKKYYLDENMVKPQSFISAVGTDSVGKQELSPKLVANSLIVADLINQAKMVGELQYQNSETIEKIYLGELHEFITVKKSRPETDKTVIYDSTGTALQDIASAVKIFNKIVK